MANTEHILQLASSYEENCLNLIKEGRIKKLPNGKYRVLSEKGKNLGTSDSRAGAKKRLQQVEYFKHQDKNNAEDTKTLDFTKADDFSYSAIMRCLRQHGSREQVLDFLKLYKKYFDKAVKGKLQKPEKVALQNCVVRFSKLHPVKLSKKMIKKAAISELGDPVLVGKYLSDIIRFSLTRIPVDKRASALSSLRSKIYHMSETQLSEKQMPATASIGQSITFIKHVLFNHDARYIREVLNNITRNLV